MAATEELTGVHGHSHKSEKKHKKKDRSDRKEKKKRSREDDAELVHGERKPKRPKSIIDEPTRAVSPDLSSEAPFSTAKAIKEEDESPRKTKKKHKKDKHRSDEAEAAEAGEDRSKKHKRKSKSKHDDAQDAEQAHNSSLGEVNSGAVVEVPFSDSEQKSAKKEKKKKKHHHHHQQPSLDLSTDHDATNADDAMSIDTPNAHSSPTKPKKSTSRLHQPPNAPSKPQYPFFTQTVSLFLPLYPVGWAEPSTAAAVQHLQPMVNRYVPTLKGVLLAFRNVTVSEHPGRDPSDACELVSVNEFAVGFGWVTVDVDLFMPKRGAWMEGSINLESEGHVGVVCWSKFNASIESARLPPEWRWVHLESEEAEADTRNGDDAVSNFTAEEQHGAVRQIHSTGYWVDGAGRRAKGRVRFRIKAFDVGVSGDHGYLSIEGTMLDEAGEKEARAHDAAQERRRQLGKSRGVLAKERRHVPEFSVTNFGQVEDEEEKALRQEVWNTTEPVTDNEGRKEEQ